MQKTCQWYILEQEKVIAGFILKYMAVKNKKMA